MADPSAARPVAAEPTTAQAPSQGGGGDPSTAELLTRLSAQVGELVREELELARAEMAEKVRHLGLGAGLVSTAGLLALYGLAAAVATAVIALGLVVAWWLAGLIVTVVLLGAAGVAALVGKRQIDRAAPPTPTRAMASTRLDVEEIVAEVRRGEGGNSR